MKKIIITLQICFNATFIIFIIKDFFPSLPFLSLLTIPLFVTTIVVLGVLEASLSKLTKINTNKEHFYITIIALFLIIIFITTMAFRGIQSQSEIISPALLIVLVFSIVQTYKEWKELRRPVTEQV
ncbi:hypothetical protein [Alkalicoccobacillus gibsonii]|uniref:hypothetical protein n=1 Tax=Alkalicoccobacillus gibsonii TaxID=79881 RepID=UPI001932C40C|nr:hypothetical protein [Alkalicoccobacillus gibsonii]MBM0064434.1 hypothetical protein [Alkalicoccobacillus gibsonii]